MKDNKYNMKQKDLIYNVLVGLVLLFIMAGGCYLIVHNSSWSMDDACMIQSKVGSGIPTHLNDYPGFQPKEGRLFPMAYMHTNLILLFSRGDYCSAKPFYILNAVFWILFVLQLYFLVYLILKEKVKVTDNVAKWMSLLVLLIFCQRVIEVFSFLWSTACVSLLLIVTYCLLFYFYSRGGKRKTVYGVLSLVVLLYYTFCGELCIILPFCIGFGLVLNRRKLDYMSISCLSFFLLFVVSYVSLILPYTEKFYDGSHGSSETFFSNLLNELLFQKLLIVVFLVFAFRLFAVFVQKKKYDEFSDLLLLAGVGGSLGCFVLRLHGMYYLGCLVLSMPAMLCAMNFDSVKNKVLSYAFVLLIVGYYVVKCPKTCKSIYERKASVCMGMAKFEDELKDEDDVVWYAEELEEGNMDNIWLYGHLVANLRHLKRDPSFAVKPFNELKGGMVLLSPETTDITPIVKQFPELKFVEKSRFVTLTMYRVE